MHVRACLIVPSHCGNSRTHCSKSFILSFSDDGESLPGVLGRRLETPLYAPLVHADDSYWATTRIHEDEHGNGFTTPQACPPERVSTPVWIGDRLDGIHRMLGNR